VLRCSSNARQLCESFFEVFQELRKESLEICVDVAQMASIRSTEARVLVDRIVHGIGRLIYVKCDWIDWMWHRKGAPKLPLHSSLPISFVLLLLSKLYCAFVFTYMPAAGIAFNSPTSIVFHALICLILLSYNKAVHTPPGECPKTEEWTQEGNPPPNLREVKRSTGEARWCHHSNAYKPDRAHFCRVLGECVQRMDHHCPWIGNTVGYQNHKFFFLFLMYANAACCMAGVNIISLLIQATLPALSEFLLFGATGLAAILVSLLAPFFLFHIYLLCRNLTTIEFCERIRNRSDVPDQYEEHPYDLGVFQNVSSILGSNPLMWAIPFGKPAGDGLHFQRRGDVLITNTEIRRDQPDEDPERVPPVAGGTTDDDGSISQQPVFLGWQSPKQFKEDLKLGCEVISDVLEGALTRFSCLSTPHKWRSSRRVQVARQPARIVPVKRSEIPVDDQASTIGSAADMVTYVDFLSD